MEFRFRAKSGNQTFDEPSHRQVPLVAKSTVKTCELCSCGLILTSDIFQGGQDDLIAQDVIHQLMSSIDMDCVPRLNSRPIDLSKRDFHILSLHFVHGSCSSIDRIDTLKEYLTERPWFWVYFLLAWSLIGDYQREASNSNLAQNLISRHGIVSTHRRNSSSLIINILAMHGHAKRLCKMYMNAQWVVACIGEDGHINYTEFVASLLQVQGAKRAGGSGSFVKS